MHLSLGGTRGFPDTLETWNRRNHRDQAVLRDTLIERNVIPIRRLAAVPVDVVRRRRTRSRSDRADLVTVTCDRIIRAGDVTPATLRARCASCCISRKLGTDQRVRDHSTRLERIPMPGSRVERGFVCPVLPCIGRYQGCASCQGESLGNLVERPDLSRTHYIRTGRPPHAAGDALCRSPRSRRCSVHRALVLRRHQTTVC